MNNNMSNCKDFFDNLITENDKKNSAKMIEILKNSVIKKKPQKKTVTIELSFGTFNLLVYLLSKI